MRYLASIALASALSAQSAPILYPLFHEFGGDCVGCDATVNGQPDADGTFNKSLPCGQATIDAEITFTSGVCADDCNSGTGCSLSRAVVLTVTNAPPGQGYTVSWDYLTVIASYSGGTSWPQTVTLPAGFGSLTCGETHHLRVVPTGTMDVADFKISCTPCYYGLL